MPNAAEVKIDPIVVLSPDIKLSKIKSEPNKQLTFPETQRRDMSSSIPVAVPRRKVPGRHSKDPHGNLFRSGTQNETTNLLHRERLVRMPNQQHC